jgi:hypothetical protein
MTRFNSLVLTLVAAFCLSILPSFAAPPASPAKTTTKTTTTKKATPAAKTATKSMSQQGKITAWDGKKNAFTLTNGSKSWKFTYQKGHFAQVGSPAVGASATVWYTGAKEPYTATKLQVAKAAATTKAPAKATTAKPAKSPAKK